MTSDLPAVRPGPSSADERAAELLERFLASRKTQNTRAAYRRDLTSWLEWCTAHGVDPDTALPAHVQQWAAERGGANTSQARWISAVSSWYRWINRQRLAAGLTPQTNPADLGDERPTVNWLHTNTIALSRAQAIELQELADADHHSSAAIVCLLLHTGMRSAELFGTTIADMAMDGGEWVLFVTRKGGARDRLPLARPTVVRIDRHLAARDAQRQLLPTTTVNAGQSPPLVVNRHGRPLNRDYVWRLLKRLAARGTPDLQAARGRLHAHVLRHTVATGMIRDDRPLLLVADLLGHQNLNTTRRYAHAEGSSRRTSVERLAEMFTPHEEEASP